MIDILFWLIISSIAALVGAALGRLVTLRAYSPLTRLLLFVTLGYLVLAYLLLGLGLLGYLQPVPVLVVLAIVLLVGLIAFRTLWRDLCTVTSKIRHALLASPARWLYWFVLLCTLASLIPALAPPAGLDWDGLAEHLAMAKEWTKAGRVIPLWYDHHSQFPATLQMLYALALLFRGASAAKLFHFGFGLIALGAVFALTRRHISRPAAPWAAVILAATPVFSWLMGVAYVDLPIVACALLSVHFFLEWVSSGAARDAALSGLLAGAAMAFKMQGIPYFGLLLIFAVYIAWRGRRQETPRWRGVAIFAAVGLLVASPWYVKSWVITGNPVYPFAYSTFGGKEWSAQQAEWYRHHQLQFGVGELPPQEVLDALPWYKRTFAGPRQPLRLLLAPLNLTFRPIPFTVPISPLAVVTCQSIGPLYLIFAPVLLLLTSGHRRLKTLLVAVALLWLWWLYSMQLTRYLLPTLALLAPATGYALHRCTQHKGVLRGTTLAVVAMWLAIIFLIKAMSLYTALPVVAGTVGREQYLASSLAPYPVISYINSYTRPEAKVISYGDVRLFYLERDYLWGDPVYHRMIIYDTMTGPAELLAAYDHLGITHILYRPDLLNRLSADREPVGPLLQAALEEGYVERVVGRFPPGPYQLLRVTERGRQVLPGGS